MTLSFYHILCIFLTRLWYCIIQMYIKTQREVQILPLIRSHCYSKFSMALRCISPLFGNLKYISYIVKIGEGGGYVVKTYPSIDPIVPPPNIYAYKCQINNIACCDVMTSQHVWLILSDGDQNDLARQQPRVVTQLRSI